MVLFYHKNTISLVQTWFIIYPGGNEDEEQGSCYYFGYHFHCAI